MQFKDNFPIYLQICDLIKNKIMIGEIKQGEKLPSIRTYAMELSVNQNTIVNSLKELDKEGIVYTKRGLGTFIVEDEKLINILNENKNNRMITKFIEEAKERGLKLKEVKKILKKIEEKIEDEFNN